MVREFGIDSETAKNLIHSYGLTALRVVKLGQKENLNERLHPDYPFLKAEVLYAIRNEMAEKPNDVICRRVPIAVLNTQVSKELLPSIVEIMGKEKRWSNAIKKQELEEAIRNLDYIK